MKIAAILIVAGCSAPAAARRSAPEPKPTPAPVAHAISPPDAAPAAPPCDPSNVHCRCDAGESHACLQLADAEFQRGDHDAAIVAAFAVCDRGEPTGCLAAAAYLDQLHLASRLATTPQQLRDRAVASYEQTCGAGGAAACFALGELLLRGRQTALDPVRGIALVERACELGDARGCATLGSAYAVGHHARKDPTRAAALFDKACELGDARGCALLGDTVRDPARAAALFAKACDGDDAAACARSGRGLAHAGDRPHALGRFRRACALDDAASCVDAARLHVAANEPAKAREQYRLGCELDLGPACAALAALVAKGTGGERDWGAAVALYDKACALRLPASCTEAARLRRTLPDGHCTSIEQCRRLCAEGLGKSCAQLGRLVAAAGGEHACEAAADAYATGCDRNDGESCRLVGNAELTGIDADRSYERACTHHDADGCVLHDYLRSQHADEPTEQTKLVRSLQHACAANPRACIWYAAAVQDEDRPAATRILRAACDHDRDGRACRLLSTTIGWAQLDRDAADGEVTDYAAVRRGMLRKGCGFGDMPSCGLLETTEGVSDAEIAAMKTRVEAATAQAPCAPDDLKWEEP